MIFPKEIVDEIFERLFAFRAHLGISFRFFNEMRELSKLKLFARKLKYF